MSDELKFLKSLPPMLFLRVMKLVAWIMQAEEEHGYRLIYQDEELLVFKRKT